MTPFEVTIRCTACLHRYKRIIKAADADHLAMIPDPPCPKCATKVKRARKFDFDSGKAPSVGGSIVVRAVDTTLNIVAEDHRMTDLRTDVREGESMAPKLTPRLQAMADGMFSRPKNRRSAGGIFDLPPRAVMQAAVSGRFKTADTPNPVAIQHGLRDRAPVHIIAGDGVKPRGG